MKRFVKKGKLGIIEIWLVRTTYNGHSAILDGGEVISLVKKGDGNYTLNYLDIFLQNSKIYKIYIK